MDQKLLLELLAEAQKRGGGLLLNVGDSPQAVVLSVDAYTELLAGRPSTLLAGTATAHAGEAPAEPKTILVTGGAGYIGAHVVREALAQGYKVIILDNFSTGKREYVPVEAIAIEGDVRDVSLLRDIFSQYPVDAVVHLAALLEVQESVEKPLEYLDVNTLATSRLLQIMAEAGVRKFVFSSTAAVYGPQTSVPIAESAVCSPTNPYGMSKCLAEQAIQYMSKFAGLQATVLRFFNVAGTHEAWGITDTHHRAHLIPIILDVAKGKQSTLTVNGGDYETVDGTCVRDYVHVYDIARAHIAVLQREQIQPYAVYNIGTGRGASVREVVQATAEVTGRMIPMEVGPRRPGDDAALVADANAIARDLGFKTSYSDLETIISSAWAIQE